MESLSSAFPFVVVIVSLVLIGAAIRLDRKLSRGARSAGPRHPERPAPAGQNRTPWELRAIDNQLWAGPGSVARANLVDTINRLIDAAGLPDYNYRLDRNASDAQINSIITHLEKHLDLGELPPPVVADPTSRPPDEPAIADGVGVGPPS